MAGITTENAKEMQAKGVQKRQQNMQKLKEQAAKLPQLQELAISVACNSTTLHGEPYRMEQLTRAREHIARLNALIAQETDPLRLEKLYNSLSKVSEMQRILAGWAMPGSLRPRQERTRRNDPQPEPMEYQPPVAPTPQAVSDPGLPLPPEPNG